MTLQSSGAISLADVQTEFGGSNPIGINEYYGVAAGIPASGTISLNNFYGKSASPAFAWTTYIMGYSNTIGQYLSADSYFGNIVTPGSGASPVTFQISITLTPSGGGALLELYIGGSIASTWSGNTYVSSVTSFGSSSLQFRSYLSTGYYAGYNTYAAVYVGGSTIFYHVTDYEDPPGGDD